MRKGQRCWKTKRFIAFLLLLLLFASFPVIKIFGFHICQWTCSIDFVSHTLNYIFFLFCAAAWNDIRYNVSISIWDVIYWYWMFKMWNANGTNGVLEFNKKKFTSPGCSAGHTKNKSFWKLKNEYFQSIVVYEKQKKKFCSDWHRNVEISFWRGNSIHSVWLLCWCKRLKSKKKKRVKKGSKYSTDLYFWWECASDVVNPSWVKKKKKKNCVWHWKRENTWNTRLDSFYSIFVSAFTSWDNEWMTTKAYKG